MSKELQFNKIYEETKDFGRTQFVKEIQMQINDNKSLKQKNQQLKIQISAKEEEYKKLEEQKEQFMKSIIGTKFYSGTEILEIINKIERGVSNE